MEKREKRKVRPASLARWEETRSGKGKYYLLGSTSAYPNASFSGQGSGGKEIPLVVLEEEDQSSGFYNL